MEWCWYFLIYSVLGFLVECLYARATGGRPDRKRTLLLPLCPVYGAGMCGGVLLAPLCGSHPLRLYLLGALVCTAAEYGAALWYERVLGVSFWDYRGRRGNFQGRVCPAYSAAWGALFLFTYTVIQPGVARFAMEMPPVTTLCAAGAAAFDLTVSGVLLRRMGDRACLRWYDGFRKRAVPLSGAGSE